MMRRLRIMSYWIVKSNNYNNSKYFQCNYTKQKNSDSGSICFSDVEPEEFSEGQTWIGN